MSRRSRGTSPRRSASCSEERQEQLEILLLMRLTVTVVHRWYELGESGDETVRVRGAGGDTHAAEAFFFGCPAEPGALHLATTSLDHAA